MYHNGSALSSSSSASLPSMVAFWFTVKLQLSPSPISHCFFSSLMALDAAAAIAGLLSSASLCKKPTNRHQTLTESPVSESEIPRDSTYLQCSHACISKSPHGWGCCQSIGQCLSWLSKSQSKWSLHWFNDRKNSISATIKTREFSPQFFFSFLVIESCLALWANRGFKFSSESGGLNLEVPASPNILSILSKLYDHVHQESKSAYLVFSFGELEHSASSDTLLLPSIASRSIRVLINSSSYTRSKRMSNGTIMGSLKNWYGNSDLFWISIINSISFREGRGHTPIDFLYIQKMVLRIRMRTAELKTIDDYR